MPKRARSHLNVMREALAMMRVRSRQLMMDTRNPERDFWWHLANDWEGKIISYETHNKLAKVHPQLGRKVLLPGNNTAPYYMSKSIIRMLKPYVSDLDTSDDN
jgi:hypothetical protein